MIRRTWRARWGPLLLLIALALICSPRFNRNTQSDQEQYVQLVRYLRGQTDSSELSAPFAYRLAGPLLASTLPFEPMTALNTVNLVALEIATLLLYRSILLLPRGKDVALAGSALFVCSFPAFYYGTIGYVDPVLICFLGLFVFAALSQNRWLAAIAFLLGCLAKESMLLAVPAYLASAAQQPGRRRSQHLIGAVAVLLVGGILLMSMRWMIPVAQDLQHVPSLELVVANVSRPRAWLSVLLTLGLPGTLLGALLSRRIGRAQLFSHPVGLTLLLGALGGISFLLAACSAAYVDGRPAWTLYPFAVPMIALMWSQKTTPEVNVQHRGPPVRGVAR